MSVIALQYVKLGQLQWLLCCCWFFFSDALINSKSNSQAKRSNEEEGESPGSSFFSLGIVYLTRQKKISSDLLVSAEGC